MIHRYGHRDLLLIFFADDTTEEQLVRTKERRKRKSAEERRRRENMQWLHSYGTFQKSELAGRTMVGLVILKMK